MRTGTKKLTLSFILTQVVSVSQAQESPEPVYDLSECGLKAVPGGTYARIKIMLKEGLLLQVRS